ncbi:Oleosin 18.5 kDa [Morella rubra]|uniref:Oleosin n=1 Tax=Morella rubra TaxID=262757 RepID=A0A6A1UZ28_9ROSI|nr:Oleosin 18.5 kDa [Morella rubra]
MSDQARQASQQLYECAPPSRQTVKLLTAITIGVTLMFLSGLTLTGTMIALFMATPILVLFSPVLVPAAIVTFLVVTGFVFSGGCGVAAITALSWIYNYVTGKHPPGADKLDYARMRISEKARDMKERAKEYGQFVQSKAQEATQATG